MRCIRPKKEPQVDSSTEPCQRCRRTNRVCNIPEPRKLGRKRGAIGRYQGFEKAYRKMQSEFKKMKTSHRGENIDDMANLVAGKKPILKLLFSNHPVETTDPTQISPEEGTEGSCAPCFDPTVPSLRDDEPPANVVSRASRRGEISQSSHEPISNPCSSQPSCNPIRACRHNPFASIWNRRVAWTTPHDDSESQSSGTERLDISWPDQIRCVIHRNRL